METAGRTYLDDLNSAQRSAVEYLGGPELVIAGAGSGKTRVLTYKIMHLLEQGYEPWRIMALTFTNKAADEMRERIAALVGQERASRLWMGTFHSIFARMLRRHAELLGYTSNFTIYDTGDSMSLIRSILKAKGLRERFKPGVVLNEISNAKNNLITSAAYAADRDIQRTNSAAHMGEMAEIYAEYARRCREANVMDFDDILLNTNILMRDHADILDQYRAHFRYILVDEYQDTNFAQHLIVRQLCTPGGNLCVVGDDAQSIYSFRGANIRNILDLRKTFPSLEIFKLEQNYRSTSNIVEAANSLIAKNKNQIQKSIFSEKDRGERIEVAEAYDDFEEGRIVANAISKVRMRNGDRYSDMAILYRTNSQSRIFEEALRNRNIPYRVYGGLAFYQRKEIKDAIAYFRLSINPDDNEALRRIINTPSRKIGEKTVDKISQTAAAHGVSFYKVITNPDKYGLDVSRSTANRLMDFAALLSSFVKNNDDYMPAYDLAGDIIRRTGLLAQYVSELNTPENVSKRDNILELLKGVKQRSEALAKEEPDAVYSMSEFLSEVSLLTDADTVEEGDVVTLMTIHAAKGLEYESVFIVGVEEDLLPNAMALSGPNAASEVEEERRLMYVAITRAKRFCMMSFTRKRIHNGQFVKPSPSRFLFDIDPSYLRFVSGASIRKPSPQASFSTTRILRPLSASTEAAPMRRPVVAPERPAAPTSAAAPGEMGVHRPSDVAQGDRILHSRFGEGEILLVDDAGVDSSMHVRFDDGNTRRLMFRFAKFKVL